MVVELTPEAVFNLCTVVSTPFARILEEYKHIFGTFLALPVTELRVTCFLLLICIIKLNFTVVVVYVIDYSDKLPLVVSADDDNNRALS